MRKNLTLASATLMAVLAIAGCSKNDLDVSNAGQVIRLTSSVQTRATSDPQATALSTNNTVGVFVAYGDNLITNGNNNSHTVGSEGALTTQTPMTYPTADGAKVNIYAYAPYSATFDSKHNEAVEFSIQNDQSTDANYIASDLLYASASNQAANANAVQLNFTHKLSQLKVSIVNNSASFSLNGASVYICGTKIATSLNPSSGNIGEASGDATDIKVATLGDVTTADAYAIIVPQTVAADTKIVKIVASDKKTYTAALSSEVAFAAGNSYTFVVTIANDQVSVSVSAPSITEWTDNTITGASAQKNTITASFQTPGNNASYENNTYTWTGSTSNLMTCFEFANGELAGYTTLTFTFSDLVTGPVRMGYYVGSTFTGFNQNGYYSTGTKVVDLTALGIDLSTVTKIAFGGNSSQGSVTIKAEDVILSW